ncbi:MAG TPA: hypothetical protein VMY40_04365 [Anaerolineae bacterium]|nr:hypothetical protein [Phycisphaerae bacterium]HUX75857.1 hypothetical protein [Anaerolineae bacterium]
MEGKIDKAKYGANFERIFGHAGPKIEGGHERLVIGEAAKRARSDLNVAPPPFKMHHSRIHGCKLNSWSDYHAANKVLGLVDTGEKHPSAEKGVPLQVKLPPPVPKSPFVKRHLEHLDSAGNVVSRTEIE